MLKEAFNEQSIIPDVDSVSDITTFSPIVFIHRAHSHIASYQFQKERLRITHGLSQKRCTQKHLLVLNFINQSAIPSEYKANKLIEYFIYNAIITN